MSKNVDNGWYFHNALHLFSLFHVNYVLICVCVCYNEMYLRGQRTESAKLNE